MSVVPRLDLLEAAFGDGLEQLIAAARQQLAELDERRRDLDREIAACSRKLRTWENVQASLARGPGNHLRLADAEPPTKREAVLAFLSERPDENFRLVEIRQALIGRGWMTDGRRAVHALEVAVATMAERGDIQRVRKGIYALRPRPPDPEDERADEKVADQTRWFTQRIGEGVAPSLLRP